MAVIDDRTHETESVAKATGGRKNGAASLGLLVQASTLDFCRSSGRNGSKADTTLTAALGGKRALALAGTAGLSGMSEVMMQLPHFPIVATTEWKQ